MTLWRERNSELMTVLRLVEKLCAWVCNLVCFHRRRVATRTSFLQHRMVLSSRLVRLTSVGMRMFLQKRKGKSSTMTPAQDAAKVGPLYTTLHGYEYFWFVSTEKEW